ncbi:hypothetical protein [Flagellimonas maritima]|uniref:hypothetical protein n=1 Tax=Flagellimonas maritima TaxID=1383885 RepID=UPI000DDA45EE|nr:hypothetical protein [Allomuricauda aurantiaca]
MEILFLQRKNYGTRSTKNESTQRLLVFYDKDGRLEIKGHSENGKKVKWWPFYDGNGNLNHKCQLQNGVKKGYCLKYMDEELKSAEKYKIRKKIKEWFSFSGFKRKTNYPI